MLSYSTCGWVSLSLSPDSFSPSRSDVSLSDILKIIDENFHSLVLFIALSPSPWSTGLDCRKNFFLPRSTDGFHKRSGSLSDEGWNESNMFLRRGNKSDGFITMFCKSGNKQFSKSFRICFTADSFFSNELRLNSKTCSIKITSILAANCFTIFRATKSSRPEFREIKTFYGFMSFSRIGPVP